MKISLLYSIFLFPSCFYNRNQICFAELTPLAAIVIAFLANHTVKDIRSFLVSYCEESVQMSLFQHSHSVLGSFLCCFFDCIWDVASDRSMDCLDAWAIPVARNCTILMWRWGFISYLMIPQLADENGALCSLWAMMFSFCRTACPALCICGKGWI